MPKPKDGTTKKQAKASMGFLVEEGILEKLRIEEIAEKSGEDYERIATMLRELTGKKFSKEALTTSWDLIRILLAEAIELRNRPLIYNMVLEIIKRKEPKQAHVKTESTVDHKILHLVKEIEDTDIENLISRRNAITVGHGQTRSVRAIPDRRGTGKEKS